MRVFKHKRFSQWAKKEGILDLALKSAADELSQGLFEANLGGGLYKKRAARQGQGKRAGYRTLVAFKQKDRAIFIFGFAKNERANIGKTEKEVLKRLAKDYLAVTEHRLKKLLELGEIIEVISWK